MYNIMKRTMKDGSIEAEYYDEKGILKAVHYFGPNEDVSDVPPSQNPYSPNDMMLAEDMEIGGLI